MKALQISAGVSAIGLVSGFAAASIAGGRRVALLRHGAGVLMRYSTRAHRAALVVAAALPGAATWMLFAGGAPSTLAVPLGLLLVGGGLVLVVHVVGSSVLVRPDALVGVSPWRGTARIEWASVARVRWIPALRSFEVAGADHSRIRVPRSFRRFGWFALALTQHTALASVADWRTHNLLIESADEFEVSAAS